MFEIATPRYLASPMVRELLLNVAKAAPLTLQPNRCRSSASTKTPVLNLDRPSALDNVLPGERPYEGDIALYRAKDDLELGVLWRRGDMEWLKQSKMLPFNTAYIAFRDGVKGISDPDLFPKLVEMWLRLCAATRAAYGYCFLQDPTSSVPRGEGRCLPRLHWKTYIGEEYSTALALDNLSSLASIESSPPGFVVTLPGEPAQLVNPTESERVAIRILGQDFFWNETDSWRAPQGAYRMPKLDWSDVVTNWETQLVLPSDTQAPAAPGPA